MNIDKLITDLKKKGSHDYALRDGRWYGHLGPVTPRVKLRARLITALDQAMKDDARVFPDVFIEVILGGEPGSEGISVDGAVTLDPEDVPEEPEMASPTVIIDIFSPPTTRAAMLEKLVVLTQKPTLKDYVLISSDVAEVEIFTRERGLAPTWISRTYRAGHVLEIASLGFTYPVEAIYAGLH